MSGAGEEEAGRNMNGSLRLVMGFKRDDDHHCDKKKRLDEVKLRIYSVLERELFFSLTDMVALFLSLVWSTHSMRRIRDEKKVGGQSEKSFC